MPRNRNVVFDRGRGFRVEDDRVRSLHLGPDRGAAIGEYGAPEPGEYSDSYYAPADAYPGRSQPSTGYERERYQRGRDARVEAGSVGPQTPTRTPGYVGHGQMREGQRSWADLGASSVRAGQAGVTEGAFRGRGPKGYQRSDDRLRELICERLTDDPWVDATDIEVQVRNGEVTVTGAVEDRRTKYRVEDLIEDCTRGALVHNRLQTRGGAR